jgi:hypothetical protein
LRRPTASLRVFALFLAASAALTSAGHGRAQACDELTDASLRAGVDAAVLIVIAGVAPGTGADNVVLTPETYFKGAAEGRPFVLERGDAAGDCPPATLLPGTRVLLFLESVENRLAWPDSTRAFVLEGGAASNAATPSWVAQERELSERIQDLTGQASVPVQSAGEGRQIDWWGTVVPVGSALVVVFAVGLLLMRTWHRIDPS